MLSQEVVAATLREGKFNKNAARRVRVRGRIPAVVYGAAQEPQAIELDPRQVTRILHSEGGHNTIFDLEIAGSAAKTKAMIVDWQHEPIKGNLIHVDLKRIALDKPMRVSVPIHLMGVPVGVTTQGGILDQVLRQVEVECLPGDIPSHIDVDITDLAFGTILRVADLPHGGKLKYLSDESNTVAHIVAVKEDKAAADAAAPAEPEVAKKGKTTPEAK